MQIGMRRTFRTKKRSRLSVSEEFRQLIPISADLYSDQLRFRLVVGRKNRIHTNFFGLNLGPNRRISSTFKFFKRFQAAANSGLVAGHSVRENL